MLACSLLPGALVSMVPVAPLLRCQPRRPACSRSPPILSTEGRPSLDELKTLDTLINRGLDTVEDAWLLARRVTADYVDPIDCLESWEDPEDTRPRLLVIGSGWAAHALVKIVDADLYRLLVVSPRNFFLFTPMLAASSVGTVEYRSITEPMRASNPRAAFIQGMVTDIDPVARRCELCIGDVDAADAASGGGRCSRVEYDICVYAAGVQASTSTVPGVREHCFFLKELSDAQMLRLAVSSALERASEPGLSVEERKQLLTLVVVGGGATGVEYCGELSDFLQDALARLYPALLPFSRVLLLHGGDELLPQFDPPLRQKALATLRARRVEVMLGTRVEVVERPTRLVIKRKRGGSGGSRGGSSRGSSGGSEVLFDRSTVNCGLVMWAAGTGPAPLTDTLNTRLVDCTPPGSVGDGDGDGEGEGDGEGDGAGSGGAIQWMWDLGWLASGGTVLPSPQLRRKDQAFGRIAVDPWLRVIGAPLGSLLALGDAALCCSADGSALPQTAQVAAQQGAYVARLLNRGYDLRGDLKGAISRIPLSEEAAARETWGGDEACELAGPPISRAAASGDLGRRLALRGAVEARSFEFLNLGLLACALPSPNPSPRPTPSPTPTPTPTPTPAPTPAPTLTRPGRGRGSLASPGRREPAAERGGVDRLSALAFRLRGEAGVSAHPLPRALRLGQDQDLRARCHVVVMERALYP